MQNIYYVDIWYYIMSEGSFEVKLPTIWTNEKQRREESEKRREETRRDEKRREEKRREEKKKEDQKRESLRRKKIRVSRRLAAFSSLQVDRRTDGQADKQIDR